MDEVKQLALWPNRPTERRALLKLRGGYEADERGRFGMVCRDCGQVHPPQLFTPQPRNTGRFGLHSYCHDCRARQMREYRARQRLSLSVA